jgi:demethylmenaquinone methyltransferase/2-methoxy-6-polyprenyl-1,4-benzoquinol methylase
MFQHMNTSDTSGSGHPRTNPGPDPASDSGSDTADFGFRRVPADEKAKLVRTVFDSVASRYDLMNDLMSGGIHRLWKDVLIDRLDPRPGTTLLDVAGGTGDIALRFLKRVHARSGTAEVIICDINRSMLEVGRDRAIDQGQLGGLQWVCGDAEALPIESGSVDAYTIAFGLRNVTHKQAALEEAYRVLRPGGRFFCLEFSQVVLPVLSRLYDLYSFRLLPAIGQIVAGDRDAYVYLVESIRCFPPQDELAAMMRNAGFDLVKYRNLTGGIAALHSGWRI